MSIHIQLFITPPETRLFPSPSDLHSFIPAIAVRHFKLALGLYLILTHKSLTFSLRVCHARTELSCLQQKYTILWVLYPLRTSLPEICAAGQPHMIMWKQPDIYHLAPPQLSLYLSGDDNTLWISARYMFLIWSGRLSKVAWKCNNTKHSLIQGIGHIHCWCPPPLSTIKCSELAHSVKNSNVYIIVVADPLQ